MLRTRLSTSLRKLMQRLVDSGWLGLTPLEKHVVICGFPRSGSTLLLLITECCVANARTFGRGQPALTAAERALRNHQILLTKRPRDIFGLPAIRQHYCESQTQLRCILTIRDPRAILTSYHAKNPATYYVSAERWLETYETYRREASHPDVATVRFEDLITTPGTVETNLTEFIGWTLRLPFDQYYTAASQRRLKSRLTSNLNGMRPLDSATLQKWKHPMHRGRISRVLDELPHLPDHLIELGYERDTQWVNDYL